MKQLARTFAFSATILLSGLLLASCAASECESDGGVVRPSETARGEAPGGRICVKNQDGRRVYYRLSEWNTLGVRLLLGVSIIGAISGGRMLLQRRAAIRSLRAHQPPPTPKSDWNRDEQLSESPPSDKLNPLNPLLIVLASLLKAVVSTSGIKSRMWVEASSQLSALSDGELSPASAFQLLVTVQPDLDTQFARLMPLDFRVTTLELCVSVAGAEGSISLAALSALRHVSMNLDISTSQLDQIIADSTYVRGDTEIIEALQVLGLGPDATSAEIDAARLELIKRWHPDRSSVEKQEEAQRRTAEINAAYDKLKSLAEEV